MTMLLLSQGGSVESDARWRSSEVSRRAEFHTDCKKEYGARCTQECCEDDKQEMDSAKSMQEYSRAQEGTWRKETNNEQVAEREELDTSTRILKAKVKSARNPLL